MDHLYPLKCFGGQLLKETQFTFFFLHRMYFPVDCIWRHCWELVIADVKGVARGRNKNSQRESEGREKRERACVEGFFFYHDPSLQSPVQPKD